ncbi:hypothetical protein V6N12_003514 [Hibiscus sabdariffa]|uniref:Uncharacterized protein n=1 Tax=Hibiscus sabdariffa TaxID=183260 RepID=A0ABR1Z7U5_9ROSI
MQDLGVFAIISSSFSIALSSSGTLWTTLASKALGLGGPFSFRNSFRKHCYYESATLGNCLYIPMVFCQSTAHISNPTTIRVPCILQLQQSPEGIMVNPYPISEKEKEEAGPGLNK